MATLIEAAKQALEALEFNQARWQGKDAAITALRAAIEAYEKQEPYGYFRYDIRLDAWVQNRESNKGVAFYTTPPAAQRQWVGLTKDDLREIIVDLKRPADLYKAIEAKLKEKNT